MPNGGTEPASTDVAQKPRTLDRLRPEKPPPPLPRTLRSQVGDTLHNTLQDSPHERGVHDAGDDAGVTESAAMHDEQTYL